MAAIAGGAVALGGMWIASRSESLVKLLESPTVTPTSSPTITATAMPTETSTPAPTETPNPDPWKSSCAVFELATARLLDAYDEKIHVYSDDLGVQYGLAEAIMFLGAAASDRSCGNAIYDWTAIRRKFTFIADKTLERFDQLEEIASIREDYSPAIAHELYQSHHCGFYTEVVLILSAMAVKSERAHAPDTALLVAVHGLMEERLVKPMNRIYHCDGGSKPRTQRRK